MKILLIWPPPPDYHILTQEFSCCEPLGLEYIASPLMNEGDIKIIDMRFDKDISCILSQENPDIIGLAIPFTLNVNICNELMKKIKEFNPKIKIIIGGHHPTVGLRGIWVDYVDYVVVGEGAKIFYDLIIAIRDNLNHEIIKGIGFKKNNNIYFTEKSNLTTIDDYLMPARSLVKKYEKKYFHAHYKPVTLMRFSYGCPYNCSFCVLWKLCERKHLSRNNEKIIQELLSIENQNIYVVDDEACIKTKHMLELANLIVKNNIQKKFHMYVRTDTVVKNPNLFEAWGKAGLDSVLIGMESIFDDELLNCYNKKIDQQMALKSLEILHANGIEVRANFIIRPTYGKKEFEQIKKYIEGNNIDRPTFSVLTPFFGTEEYDNVKDQMIIEKFEFFDCYHTFLDTKLPLKDFYAEFAELFRFAKNRGDHHNDGKIFYGGDSEKSFENMLKKMTDSYLYY